VQRATASIRLVACYHGRRRAVTPDTDRPVGIRPADRRARGDLAAAADRPTGVDSHSRSTPTGPPSRSIAASERAVPTMGKVQPSSSGASARASVETEAHSSAAPPPAVEQSALAAAAAAVAVAGVGRQRRPV